MHNAAGVCRAYPESTRVLSTSSQSIAACHPSTLPSRGQALENIALILTRPVTPPALCCYTTIEPERLVSPRPGACLSWSLVHHGTILDSTNFVLVPCACLPGGESSHAACCDQVSSCRSLPARPLPNSFPPDQSATNSARLPRPDHARGRGWMGVGKFVQRGLALVGASTLVSVFSLQYALRKRRAKVGVAGPEARACSRGGDPGPNSLRGSGSQPLMTVESLLSGCNCTSRPCCSRHPRVEPACTTPCCTRQTAALFPACAAPAERGAAIGLRPGARLR